MLMKRIVLLTACVMTLSASFAQKALNKQPVNMPLPAMTKSARNLHAPSKIARSLVMQNNVNKNLVSRAEEEASELRYLTPGCTFYADGYAYMYQPAYADIAWQNVSSENYTSFSWLYENILGEMAESNETHLVAAHAPGIATVPELVSGDVSYQFTFSPDAGPQPYNIMYGWNPKMYNGLEDRDLTFYDAWEEGLTATWTDTYCAGSASDADLTGGNTFDENASADWSDYLQRRYGMNMTKVQNEGYCLNFPAPAAPYVLRSITFYTFMVSEPEAELKLNLYANINNTLYKVGEASTIVEEACDFSGAAITFKTTSKDELGLIRNYMVVDYPLVAELTGFRDNEKITGIIPRLIFETTDIYPYVGNHSATHITTEGDQQLNTFINLPQWTYTFQDGTKKVATTYLSSFDAYYPFLALFDENGENMIEGDTLTIRAKGEGETIVYAAQAYEEDTSNWLITDENGENLPSWLSVKTEDENVVEGENQYTITRLYINVDPIEEGTRSATVVVDAGGEGVATRTFIVSQDKNDTTGITEVDGANNGIEAVYSLDGRKLSSGNMGKGVYIVKKTDGTTEKVIRK